MTRIVLITLARFLGVSFCIVVLMFAAAVAIDLISNPITIVAEDSQ